MMRVIELSGGPAVGKTTAVGIICNAVPEGVRVMHLQHRWVGPDYRYSRLVLLFLRHLPMWLGALWVLARATGPRMAGTRVAKYLVHLWRRREEIRLAQYDVLIEDEAFISWAATDLSHAPRFAHWLRKHASVLYPETVNHRAVGYDILPLQCSELVRVNRILRRRLSKGSPAQAARRTRKNGLRTGSWRMERVARDIMTSHAPTRMVTPACYPARLAHEFMDDRDH